MSIKNNPNFDGIVLMDKNYALTLRLQTKDGGILWEIEPRSEWVMLADESDVIFIIGKKYGEGYFTIDRAFYEGVSIYDKYGNLIKNIEDTGKIEQAELLSNGNLVLLTYDSLRMINANGNELWKVTSEAKSFRVSGQGDFVVTIKPILSPQGWESFVYDQNGRILGNFSKQGSYWDMKLFSEINQLRILVGENQYLFEKSMG